MPGQGMPVIASARPVALSLNKSLNPGPTTIAAAAAINNAGMVIVMPLTAATASIVPNTPFVTCITSAGVNWPFIHLSVILTVFNAAAAAFNPTPTGLVLAIVPARLRVFKYKSNAFKEFPTSTPPCAD